MFLVAHCTPIFGHKHERGQSQRAGVGGRGRGVGADATFDDAIRLLNRFAGIGAHSLEGKLWGKGGENIK